MEEERGSEYIQSCTGCTRRDVRSYRQEAENLQRAENTKEALVMQGGKEKISPWDRSM